MHKAPLSPLPRGLLGSEVLSRGVTQGREIHTAGSTAVSISSSSRLRACSHRNIFSGQRHLATGKGIRTGRGPALAPSGLRDFSHQAQAHQGEAMDSGCSQEASSKRPTAEEEASSAAELPPSRAPQKWDPALYQRHCSFVSELGMPVLELLDPQPGENILDLGCGDGTLAAKLSALGCTVTGVDSSPDMVTEAKARGVNAHVLDGHNLKSKMDGANMEAVFSNAALHWMKRDPAQVVAGVRSALRPGGRFVGEMGGFGNVAAIVTALLASLQARGFRDSALANDATATPWFYPTADEYKALLEAHGFRVEYIQLIPRPTELPGGIQSWLSAFGGYFLDKLEEEDRMAVCKDVENLLRPSLRTPSGLWIADYVRLRFKAVLDGGS